MHQIFQTISLMTGLLLSVALPKVLRKRTFELAIEDQLIAKREVDARQYDSLDYLLDWRDLITNSIIGCFALQFAAAESTTSSVKAVSQVATAVTLMAPLIVLLLIWFANWLGLTHVQSKGWKRTLYLLTVLPWYAGGLLFVWIFN